MEILYEIPLGTEGWNAIGTTNFQLLESGLLATLNDLSAKTADIQIKGSGDSDATVALDLKNSSDALMARFRNDGKVGIGVETPTETLDVAGHINVETGVKINEVQVLGVQGAVIADATEDLGSVKTQLNLVLAMLRTHGLIASS